MLPSHNPFRTAFFLLLLLLLTPFSRNALSAEKNAAVFPFAPGEKLHYAVYWAGIKAAVATLEILPMTELDGTPAWHFVMTAQTTSLVAAIYPVHDRIESWADADMTRALRYIECSKKRFTTKNVSIVFDWKTNTAHSEKNKKKQTVELKPGTFDPLSIFYFFRMQELREGLKLSRPVADRKRCVQGIAHVRGRETVHSGGQQWDTWLVEPDLSKIQNVYEKNPDANVQIWVTADERRLPVMFKSKVAVGSFTSELVGIETLPAGMPGQTAATADNQTR
jgi:hypothetical protein